MEEISPAELSAARSADGDDPFVLDVQPAENFEDWHVPGSVNLDVAQDLKEDPDAAKASLSAIPEDRDVIVVRTAGAVALLAADYLRALGVRREDVGLPPTDAPRLTSRQSLRSGRPGQ